MTTFNYEALDSTGEKVEGTIETTDKEDVIKQLRDKKLFPTKIHISKDEIKTESHSENTDGMDIKIDRHLFKNLAKYKFAGIYAGIIFGILSAVGYAQHMSSLAVSAELGYTNYRNFDIEVRAEILLTKGPWILGICIIIGLVYDGLMLLYRKQNSN